MLEELKEQVYRANVELDHRGLAALTFGNVSGVDRERGCLVIKPSGVAYRELEPGQMVVVSLEDGGVVEGELRPSSDTPTHLVLYRAFRDIGGIAHTHSTWATAWAQAMREIPVLGTTHADNFYGPIPLTEPLSGEEIAGDYETETGNAIVRRFRHLDPAEMPAVLVAGHGPFTWGKDAMSAVNTAVLLEVVARTAALTVSINPQAAPIPQALLDKHFLRKHGPDAYYGQRQGR